MAVVKVQRGPFLRTRRAVSLLSRTSFEATAKPGCGEAAEVTARMDDK